MRKNENGFGVVEGLLVLAIVGLIGFVGWYVYQQSQKTKITTSRVGSTQVTPSPEAYKRTTTVPKDWKTYSDAKNKFSLAYPKNWTVRAEEVDGELTGWIYPDKSLSPQGNPQYGFSTQGQSLDNAITERKKIVNDNQPAENGIKLTISCEKVYSLDNYKAVRIDMTSDDGTAPDSYATEFYILANKRVYVFNTGFHDEDVMKDKNVLTIFESIKIQ